MKKFFAVLVTFSLVLTPYQQAKATLGNAYDYVILGSYGGSRTSQWALIPYGAIIVGSLAGAGVANRPSGHSDMWNVVSEFEPQKAVNNDEPERWLASANFKNVSFFQPGKIEKDINTKESDFVFKNYDMKSRHLHLYQIKIPDELLKSRQKLIVDATVFYKNPKGEQLDFRILKKTDLKKAAAKLNGKKSDKLTIQDENNCAYVSQNGLKINPSRESFTLAVYMPIDEKIKNESDSSIKYVALVKIRTD